MKQIGLALILWSLDNQDRFPFNVSTNMGGTLGLCLRDFNGFDQNAFLHVMAMSNEMTSPTVLVCPSDNARKPAVDFQHLRSENITYQFRSGTNINPGNPGQILAVCPIHGHTLTVDGTVHLKGKI